MKKILFSFLFVGALLLSSCSKNKPEVVAEKFLTAINSGNFTEAKKYADEKTGQLIGMLEGFSKGEKPKPEEIKKFTITKTEENGDTAKVFYKAEGSDNEQSIDLKKIDGKWLVSIDKEQGKENGGSHEGHDHGDGGMEDEGEEEAHPMHEGDSIVPTEEAQ